MKAETHLKLWLREQIDNWQYIDSILFLIILLLSTGFTDPCDRCMVSSIYSEEPISCKDAFMYRLNMTDSENALQMFNNSNLTFEIPES